MSRVSIEFVGKIYVDNSDLLVFLADKFDCRKLMQVAQKSLDAWAGLLNAQGVLLIPTNATGILYPIHAPMVSGDTTTKPISPSLFLSLTEQEPRFSKQTLTRQKRC
jgi:hypothetical protein